MISIKLKNLLINLLIIYSEDFKRLRSELKAIKMWLDLDHVDTLHCHAAHGVKIQTVMFGKCCVILCSFRQLPTFHAKLYDHQTRLWELKKGFGKILWLVNNIHATISNTMAVVCLQFAKFLQGIVTRKLHDDHNCKHHATRIFIRNIWNEWTDISIIS